MNKTVYELERQYQATERFDSFDEALAAGMQHVWFMISLIQIDSDGYENRPLTLINPSESKGLRRYDN